MARTLNKLKVRQVSQLTEPGWYGDGGGLYLRIGNDGSRKWVFVNVRGGKRREMGLGPAVEVSLTLARELATSAREAFAAGRDPIGERAESTTLKPAPEIVTFGTFAKQYISSVESGWKNEVHRQQWRSSLRDHAGSLDALPIDTVNTDHVLDVLKPIWTTKSETASRVRGRIEKILNAAKAKGLRSRDSSNPAQFRGHLEMLLPKRSKLVRGHHAALAFSEIPKFMALLRARRAPVARLLEFIILTAARSGEALGSTWREIDLEKRLWTIPKERMKAGIEHVVPLSAAVISLLESIKPSTPDPAELVFKVKGKARSNMACNMLLRRMGHGDITTHGFRSTFRDWAGDVADCPRELVEAALAHTIQNKAERAYRRSTAVEKRRQLMEDWAAYLAVKGQGGQTSGVTE